MFDELKQIDAGVLDVGYAERDRTPVNLSCCLHCWPYDIHSYVDVAPARRGGPSVIVPYLRGYGTTRFRSNDTPRNGQQAALAPDNIEPMDVLGIESAIVAGFDWGAYRQRRRRALARPMPGDGVGERLPDRQPRGEQGAVATDRRALGGGISTTSRPNAAAPGTRSTGASSLG